MINLTQIEMNYSNFPVSNEEINKVESILNIKFPHPFQELLLLSNGFLTDDGICIYGTNEIIERNETLEVKKYARGFLAIGDDSGGRVFLMRAESNSQEVLITDSGDMDPKSVDILSDDLIEWLNLGCKITEKADSISPSYTIPYDVILVSQVTDGIKDLSKIRKGLALEISTTELLNGSKNIPFTLKSNVPYGKTIKMIDSLGDIKSKIKLVPSVR